MRFVCDAHTDCGRKTMVIAISEDTVRELEITLETACRVRIDQYVDVILLLFDYLLIGYRLY